MDVFELYNEQAAGTTTQTNEQSLDAGSSVFHYMNKWPADYMPPQTTLFQRPRVTFLNRHAEFNRKNILAVNRLNKF